MASGKILIIDDDPSFVQLYREQLGREGYAVESAHDRASALAQLAAPGWDVVLLDQRLQGTNSGLDLIADIRRLAPFAKTILVTAFASDDAIVRAFSEGAYDYLEKGARFTTLLRVKLHNAVEAARALRLATFSSEETEAEIRETWALVKAETDKNLKGKLLEDLMVLLFKTIPGFHQTSPRRQNKIEEIDLLIRNESKDPLWAKEQAFLLVECKHWSKPSGAPELRDLLYKIERRFDRCRLGFFIAPGGFSGTFKDALLAERKDRILVVLIDGEALAKLVASDDRNAFLKDCYEKAILAQNGHHG